MNILYNLSTPALAALVESLAVGAARERKASSVSVALELERVIDRAMQTAALRGDAAVDLCEAAEQAGYES